MFKCFSTSVQCPCLRAATGCVDSLSAGCEVREPRTRAFHCLNYPLIHQWLLGHWHQPQKSHAQSSCRGYLDRPAWTVGASATHVPAQCLFLLRAQPSPHTCSYSATYTHLNRRSPARPPSFPCRYCPSGLCEAFRSEYQGCQYWLRFCFNTMY